MASQVGLVYVAPRDPLDFQACLAPQDLLDLLETLESSLKVLLICSVLPSALQALQGPQECRGSRGLLATKGNKEKSAKMVRRVILAPLGLQEFQALWGYRAQEDCKDFQGHLDPLGTGVPLGFGAPQGSQEHLGKRVTGVKGDQKGSVALRVTWAGLVPKESLEWLGQAENQACQARMARTVCRDLTVRRERLVALVPQEKKAPMGCRGSLDEQGPKARREKWVELGSWARLAPLENQVSLETLVFRGSVARLVTGAQWGPSAHKVLLGLLASVASRAKKAA